MLFEPTTNLPVTAFTCIIDEKTDNMILRNDTGKDIVIPSNKTLGHASSIDMDFHAYQVTGV